MVEELFTDLFNFGALLINCCGIIETVNLGNLVFDCSKIPVSMI